MAHQALGKAHREGISIVQLMEMFPGEREATAWFESLVWPDGRGCGHCGSIKTREVPNAKPMPYWCTDCRHYFSCQAPARRWISHSKVSAAQVGVRYLPGTHQPQGRVEHEAPP